jgi:hypothetical protein
MLKDFGRSLDEVVAQKRLGARKSATIFAK